MGEQKPDTSQDKYPIADTPTSKKVNQKIVDKTGFDPVDLLGAPASPPELKNVRQSYSLAQFLLILGGGILAALGLILWVFLSLSVFGFIIMAVGAIAVIIGTLVRI